MIIVPVEKRLQWNRAPFVLFTIVFINIAIFFFYQMNDSDKYDKASEIYSEQELETIEVPLYIDYLEQPENIEQKETVEQTYNENFKSVESFDNFDSFESFEGDIAQNEEYIREHDPYYQKVLEHFVLQDTVFYDYLVSTPELFESTTSYDTWKKQREQVNTVIEDASIQKYALVPTEGKWFTYISHQFMHGDFMHLAGNMFFLIICGFAVEASIGHIRFLLFYVISGAVGGAVYTLSATDSFVPLVGASGAISGVMAMYLGIFRLQKIEFFVWFYVIVGYFRAPALLILALFMSKEIIFYFYADDNVAYMAHLGGFIGGFALILMVLVFKRDFLDEEYIEANNDIDPEQLQQAEIKEALERLHFKKALQLTHEALSTTTTNDTYYGENIFLKVKLLQLINDPDADNQIVTLLADTKPTQYQLDEYLQLWNKVTNKALTPIEGRIKLCLTFMSLEDMSVSEAMFVALIEQNVTDSRMAVLAGRFAHYYDQEQVPEKAEYYLNVSHSF